MLKRSIISCVLNFQIFFLKRSGEEGNVMRSKLEGKITKVMSLCFTYRVDIIAPQQASELQYLGIMVSKSES